MLDAVVSFLWADAAGREVLRDADDSWASSFVQNFRAIRYRDGWGIVTPTSDADFAGMCKAFGVGGYDDPRVATISERRKHRELIGEFMDRCRAAALDMAIDEAMKRLEVERVPCGVVLSAAELASDPHAQAIGLLEESVHPVAGRLRQPRHPVKFGPTRPALGGPAPALGERTSDLLAEIGLAAQVEALRTAGVVA
jgi:crotonobetainyl-CoA:carnitine CoA-transferase CaiB-like acyl-CoA transferase